MKLLGPVGLSATVRRRMTPHMLKFHAPFKS